jgi:hypothetical protein
MDGREEEKRELGIALHGDSKQQVRSLCVLNPLGHPTMNNHEQHPSFASAEVRQKHETLTGMSADAKAISRAG